ncbi:aspartate dehydrogenase [Alsobacter sp. SYSU M60028]|uniref:L-aspartate dehydrogenase n=1 Tax=Alsobacter ponti TaxID=2962936 RepID=A0ABT1L940_9HYPH|nr:aspartate dehydrogenase [Alsobacter ponti]MCP8937461.1 aspartate dehydrogenase [Alsobacter ponti]
MTGVGVLGHGALGHAIAQALGSGQVPGARLVGIAGRRLSDDLECLARACDCAALDAPSALPALGARLIVEAAGASAVREHALPLLEAGCDVILMSTGALGDAALLARLKDAATAHGRKIYLPSGAIAGLDGIRAAMEAGVETVRITTRKHPRALAGSPYLDEHPLDLAGLAEARVIFEGSARDAIAGFPSNVNVSLTLATLVGSPDRVQVRIIADPHAEMTQHRIEVTAASGTMAIDVANQPSPLNPRSSWLAALSAIAMVRQLVAPIWIG